MTNAKGCDGQPIESTLRVWAEALRTPSISEHSISDIALFNGACITDDLEVAAAEIDRLNARIDDLLATTSRHEEEARKARRERDALLQGFKGMAAAISAMPEAI